MSHDDVVEKIVERVGGKISVLLGAGASAAMGLPTMATFLDDVYGKGFVESIKNCQQYYLGTNVVTQVNTNAQAILTRLIHTASLSSSSLNYDLEALFDFVHTCRLGQSSKDIANWWRPLAWMFHICSTGGVHNYEQYHAQSKNFLTQVDTWINDITHVLSNLRQKMYERYFIPQDASEILIHARSIYDILPTVFGNSPRTIFTLNFDTIFEALDLNTERQRGIEFLIDGTKSWKRLREFSLKHYLNAESDEESIFLFKLHGSVTWERRGKDIYDVFPQIPRKDIAIAEPVLSKNTTEYPFKELYQVFEGVIQKNNLCLAIGVSFRDDNLRQVLERRLAEDPNFQLIIVAPEDKSQLGINKHLTLFGAKYKNVTWIRDYFGSKETETMILAEIKRRNPFG